MEKRNSNHKMPVAICDRRGTQKYSLDEYINKLKEKEINIVPVEDFKGTKFAINHQCLVCGYVWRVAPTRFTGARAKGGLGCPCCSSRTLVVGKNDLWTTSPELAKLLKNPEDGYKFMKKSNASTQWICPNCGEVIGKKFSIVANAGLACPSCKLGGGSYPNRLMYNVLRDIGVDFEKEQTFDWCKYLVNNKWKRGRYDFYVKTKNRTFIIEVDGGFHTALHSKSKYNLDEIKFADLEKDRLALEHGLEVVRINCEQSSLSYIKKNIYESKLRNYLDLDVVNWEMCHVKSLSSKIKEIYDLYNTGEYVVVEISEIAGMSSSVTSSYISDGKKSGIIKDNGVHGTKKKVFCITTNESFNSISDAAKKYNISTSAISTCCSGRRSFGGCLHNGEKLVWKYMSGKSHAELKTNKKEVARSRKSTKMLTHNGETKSMAEMSEIYDISYQALQYRIGNAWDIEKALTHPVATQKKHENTSDKILYNGETHRLREWCKILNLPYSTIWHRINSGWCVENALNTPVKKRKSNIKSGVRGVIWRGDSKKWRACIKFNGKRINLGSFDNKKDAVFARLSAECKYFGMEAPQACLFSKYAVV